MLLAYEQFVQCDAYPIFAELLTKFKETFQSSEEVVKRINTVFNLLDAHVYAKVGEAEQECKSLLAFLREAFSQLSTNQLAKIVMTVFYRSLFSIQIYQYKESHNGVRIPFKAYHIIESDQPRAGEFKLAQIFIKQGNFAHVKLSLNWMANLLQGLR